MLIYVILLSVQPRWYRYAPTKFAGELNKGASLVCDVRAYPAVNFTWSKSSSRMSPGQYQNTAHSSVLDIPAVQNTDYANYTCSATNVAGTGSFLLQLLPPGEYFHHYAINANYFKSEVGITVQVILRSEGGSKVILWNLCCICSISHRNQHIDA